jgi:hypothetical protein
VAAFELHGAIGSLRVGGGFAAAGGGFDRSDVVEKTAGRR